jgi:hypothetical protein
MASSTKVTVHLRAGKNPGKEPPHEAFANMRNDTAAQWAFYDRWGALHSENLVTSEQGASLRASGLPCPYVFLEAQDSLRRAWRGDDKGLDYIKLSAGTYMRFSWAFKAGRAELVAEDLWSAICVFFLRDQSAHKTGICENPHCSAPYFIKRRKTQLFCQAGPCVEYGARVRANRWWKDHGSEWRKRHHKDAAE